MNIPTQIRSVSHRKKIDLVTTTDVSILELGHCQMHMSVCHAANNAITILNKYYSQTDKCEIYRVLMSKTFIINLNVCA